MTKELSLTMRKVGMRKMGELSSKQTDIVEITGIGRYKHNLTFASEKEAEAFITKMAKIIANAYMAESIKREKSRSR